MSVYTISYEGEKKSFQYDRDNATVLYVAKASAEDIAVNQEWVTKYGKPLFEILGDGYMVFDSIGLSRENWDDKEARDEYLHGWMFEMEEELAYMMEDAVKEFGLEV